MKILQTTKAKAILNTLNPLDPKMQRYISLSKEIEGLLANASDECESCVPIELIAEFFVLQEELYKLSIDKHKNEAN